jgi:hypothetical protein
VDIEWGRFVRPAPGSRQTRYTVAGGCSSVGMRPGLPTLLVRQITGEQTTLHLGLDETIGALKEALRVEWGIEADAQQLLLAAGAASGVDAEAGGGGGLPLEEDEATTLRACGLADGAELLLTLQDAAQCAARRELRKAAKREAAERDARAEAERDRERIWAAERSRRCWHVATHALWVLLLLCGVAVCTLALWSRHADLGLVGWPVGCMLVVASSKGFGLSGNQTRREQQNAGHSEQWDGGRVLCLLAGFLFISFMGFGFSVGSCPATGDWLLSGSHWAFDHEDVTPRCSDRCSEESNGVCEDGGRGAVNSHCSLGEDTADCGCRNGTLGDWLTTSELERLERDPYDRSWHARGTVRACSTASGMLYVAVPFAVAAGVLVCSELQKMWNLGPLAEGVPPRRRGAAP